MRPRSGPWLRHCALPASFAGTAIATSDSTPNARTDPLRGPATAAAPGIDSLLRAASASAPERAALAFGGRTLTWREVDEAVDAMAARLHARPGARVAIIAANAPALVIGMFACWRSEAVAVPLSARLRRFELGRILADARVEALVTVREHARYSFEALVPELMAAIPSLRRCLTVETGGYITREVTWPAEEAEPAGGDVAAVLYTSGTTGAPKGALDTHARELAGAASAVELLGLSGGDAVVIPVPVSHAFGLVCLLGTVAAAGTAVLLDGGLPAAPIVETIAERGATVVHGSPSLFAALLKTEAPALGRVRTGFVAGAACPPALLEALDERGARILNLFGMTEIGAACACRADDPPEVRHGTVGRALDGYELRISDGELEVRSPYTTAPFAGEWFATGDLGSLSGGGVLTLSGRAKELVNVAGFNVFPSEVESFLVTHPAVVQAAVIGVPHERMGETLKAYVVPTRSGAVTPAEVVRHCRDGIAGYKIPYRVEVVAELPLLASGKPDRAALAAREGAHAPA